MRIVLMYLGRRGAGPVYSFEFARALLAQGVSVLSIISKKTENIKDWESLYSIYASNQLLEINTYQNAMEFLFKSFNLFGFWRTARIIKTFSPNAILTTMIHPWHNIILFLSGKKMLRVKVIHDVTPHLGEQTIFHKLLNKWDLKLCDKWITLTQNSKLQLQKKGIDPARIQVIPHAHFGHYSQYQPLNLFHNINYKIGFFGRISKYKGIEILIQSYKLALQQIPQLKLLIAGSGKLDCVIPKEVELYNRWIDDKEVANLLADIDIVILPYIDASQSGVIPLAFSLGKPVIATNVGGLSEQVPKNCGILVPPNNAGKLSEAIIDTYKYPNKIQEMGRSAYYYAYEHLNWECSAEAFISIVQGGKS